MNLPVAFSQLKKVHDCLKWQARECAEIWDVDLDDDSNEVEKKIGDRYSMNRKELLDLQRQLQDTAEDVAAILDNLADPWRPNQAKIDRLKREEEEAKAKAQAAHSEPTAN
jgi:hypothetical protein